MFYIDNFALRILFCIVTTVLAATLGAFVRAEFILHEAFVFNAVHSLVIPAMLGALAGFLWKKPAK